MGVTEGVAGLKCSGVVSYGVLPKLGRLSSRGDIDFSSFHLHLSHIIVHVSVICQHNIVQVSMAHQ